MGASLAIAAPGSTDSQRRLRLPNGFPPQFAFNAYKLTTGSFERRINYILPLLNILRYPVVITPPKATRTSTLPPKNPQPPGIATRIPTFGAAFLNRLQPSEIPTRIPTVHAAFPQTLQPPGFSSRIPTPGTAFPRTLQPPRGFPYWVKPTEIPTRIPTFSASFLNRLQPPEFATRIPTVGATFPRTLQRRAGSLVRRGFPYRVVGTGIRHADSHGRSRRANVRIFKHNTIAGRIVASKHNISRHICTPFDLEYV